MASKLQPLDQKFPVVKADGTPTDYFIRWAQQRQIDIQGSISAEQAQTLINDWAAARDINAGVGLSGGGSLAADRTIDLENTTVTAGSYTNADITVDAQGRLTAAANGSGGGGGSTGFAGSGMIYRTLVGGGPSTTYSDLGWLLSTTGSFAVGTISTTNRMTRAVRSEPFTGSVHGNSAGFLWSAGGNFDRAVESTYESRSGVRVHNADSRYITGIKATPNTIGGGTVEMSTFLNCAFVGCDSTDTNFQVMHNDGVGTCTKVDTGIIQAAGDLWVKIYWTASGDMVFDVEFFVASNLTTVADSIFTTTATTNLPATGTQMGPVCVAVVGPVAGYQISHCVIRLASLTPF